MNNLFSLDITKVKIPHLQDTIAKLYTEGLVGADSLAEAALVSHLQDTIAKLYTEVLVGALTPSQAPQ